MGLTEQQCLDKMISPGMVRSSKPYLGGVIQILVTSSCDKNCYNCTQLSQLKRKPEFMSPEQFEQAVLSLRTYFGVVGLFGGNPCVSKHFPEYCEIMSKRLPFPRRGIWCNNPLTVDNARLMQQTFHPGHSNLNVHMDHKAFAMFKQGWPECHPVGLHGDSRHSPCFAGMQHFDNLPVFDANHNEVGTMENTPENRHILISDCDINQKWSAGIAVVRGQLRGFFCEIAMAQSVWHQDEADYPDTGIIINDRVGYCHGPQFTCYSRYLTEAELKPLLKDHVKVDHWWQLPMLSFREQVRQHCHNCSVPLRGHGELAMSDTGKEQVSQAHAANYEPKRKGRTVELVVLREQLGPPLQSTTAYLQNSKV